MSIRLTLAAAALFAIGTPAFASNYVASLQSPAKSAQLVSSERLWSCAGTTCAAGGEATSPAKRICSRLVKEVGPLSAFTAQGKIFAADELAQCNASAAGASTAAAAQ